MRISISTLLGTALGTAVLFCAAVALAADQPSQGCETESRCFDKVVDGKKTIVCEPVKVCGKAHAPQAVYFLPRTPPTAPGADLSESFVPKIIKSTDDLAF